MDESMGCCFLWYSDKNNTTVQLFGESEMLAAFKALYVTRKRSVLAERAN